MRYYVLHMRLYIQVCIHRGFPEYLAKYIIID